MFEENRLSRTEQDELRNNADLGYTYDPTQLNVEDGYTIEDLLT